MTVRTILLLEDEAIIAMDLEITLQDNGYDVLRPCGSLEEARALVARTRPDLAILDVNLGRDQTSFGFAEEIHAEGIRVVFLSGYSASIVNAPEPLQDAPRLMKPVDERELLAAIEAAGG